MIQTNTFTNIYTSLPSPLLFPIFDTKETQPVTIIQEEKPGPTDTLIILIPTYFVSLSLLIGIINPNER